MWTTSPGVRCDRVGSAPEPLPRTHRGLLDADGDPDLLHRAVFNLVLNAVQHAGPAGRVIVELGPTLSPAEADTHAAAVLAVARTVL